MRPLDIEIMTMDPMPYKRPRTAAATEAAAAKRRQLRAENPNLRSPRATEQRLRHFADGYAIGYRLERDAPGTQSPFVKGDRARGSDIGQDAARAARLTDTLAADPIRCPISELERYAADVLRTPIPPQFLDPDFQTSRSALHSYLSETQKPALSLDLDLARVDREIAAILAGAKTHLEEALEMNIRSLRDRSDRLAALVSTIPVDPSSGQTPARPPLST
jgi:hypothetical protein